MKFVQGVIEEALLRPWAVKKSEDSLQPPVPRIRRLSGSHTPICNYSSACGARNLKPQEDLAREQGMQRAQAEVEKYEQDREVVRRQENLGREV